MSLVVFHMKVGFFCLNSLILWNGIKETDILKTLTIENPFFE